MVWVGLGGDVGLGFVSQQSSICMCRLRNWQRTCCTGPRRVGLCSSGSHALVLLVRT